MKINSKRFHEVVISDDPAQRRRVAMENNGQFHVMVIKDDRHGTEIFNRDQLRIIENARY